MAQELRQMDPQERGQRMRDFLTDLRKQVGEQLNDQQRAKFQEKVDQLRGRFRDAFAGNGAATTMPAGGQGRGAILLQRVEEALAKLDLSDAQKQVIRGIVDDARTKMLDVRAKMEAGATLD